MSSDNNILINYLLEHENNFDIILEKIALDTLSSEGIKNQTLSLSFVDDNFIRDLNKKYRNKDTATDVLSFSLNEDNILGDIVISISTAERNAEKYGNTLLKELCKLVVHGTLHLLGYDHEIEDEAKVMEDKEEYCLCKFMGDQ